MFVLSLALRVQHTTVQVLQSEVLDGVLTAELSTQAARRVEAVREPGGCWMEAARFFCLYTAPQTRMKNDDRSDHGSAGATVGGGAPK